LCKASYALYLTFHEQRNALHVAIEKLTKAGKAKNKNADSDPLISGVTAAEADFAVAGSDSDSKDSS
jgi:hypothetical protein